MQSQLTRKPVTIRRGWRNGLAHSNHNRFLAAGLAGVVAAGGATIALLGTDPVAPAKPNAAPSTPIIFGDPAVLKGARGGKTNSVPPRVFDDPTVRKGAGGR